MNSVICITGMHRSGTSLTSSWLELCGLTIHNGQFYGPDVGNPKGHFEDKEFVDLHSAALTMEHPRSGGWKAHTNKFLTFTNEHLEHARELVDQRNSNYSLWGWKDPRSIIYLKHWKQIIPSLKVLLIWRPCREVARSLIKRSTKSGRSTFKIRTIESVKLWLSYNSKVCEYKQEFPNDTLLFPLDYIVKHDQTVLHLINKKFQTELKYRAISDVYNQKLLNRGSDSLIVRLATLYYRCSYLETTLSNLSDIR